MAVSDGVERSLPTEPRQAHELTAPTGSKEHWVFHVDLDQFIAAVEVLRRPELAGKPVIVGGDGDFSKRGAVATASYEARAFGVGSGMPLRIAARKCPDGVFLPVDHQAYDEASAAVMNALRSLRWGTRPVIVEVLGWDEAFVAVGTAETAVPAEEHVRSDPLVFAGQIRSRVLAETGLHCSVGVGDNKLRAKIATEFGKPRGSFVLTAENWFEVMGERPTRALWGVGAKTAKRLAALKIETVADLARSDPRVLAAQLGPTMGPWYHRLGRGVSDSVVSAAPWVPRGHGHETTFQTDVEDWGQVAETIRTLTRKVAADINASGRPALRVVLKLRYRPFFTITRSHKLAQPTSDPARLCEVAVDLLERVEKDRAVRLVGVRLEMVPPAGGYQTTADPADPAPE